MNRTWEVLAEKQARLVQEAYEKMSNLVERREGLDNQLSKIDELIYESTRAVCETTGTTKVYRSNLRRGFLAQLHQARGVMKNELNNLEIKIASAKRLVAAAELEHLKARKLLERNVLQQRKMEQVAEAKEMDSVAITQFNLNKV